MQVYFLSESAHLQSFGTIMRQLLNAEEEDEITNIILRIKHISDSGGTPSPPTAKPLKNVDGELNEIRCKYKEDQVIRIYYFVDRDKKRMVLLNATIKPDGSKKASSYEGKSAKK